MRDKIKTKYNVSKASFEVEPIIQEVLSHSPKSILEIGTGTGYVAIELSRKGVEVTASDINKEAIVLATENARRIGHNVEFIKSDLFENITKKYDVIVFNPPINPDASASFHFLGNLIRNSRILTSLACYFAMRVYHEKRLMLILRFFKEGMPFLKNGGKFVLCITEKEAEQIVGKYNVIIKNRVRVPYNFFVICFSIN